MNILKEVSERDLSTINNVRDLRLEARRLELVIQAQEDALKHQLKTLPKEALKAGLFSVVPAVAATKLSSMAINAGTSFLANLISPKSKNTPAGGLLSGSLKSAAILSLVKLGTSFLFRKSKKK
ncbi:hypothetical protein [Flavihumibacter solisilvae]|uniref:Uncharacterized protein n=1 Tax=Flavihumibacter solisilvae TaxID=1349421 RepID=A0A0C1IF71_9BACT|nr:hypothetical protein [Flavihumibacter solisilvae]KIC92805.1 hypothetical protein OI18_20465 [Flavihumibacter solisilvae]